MPNVNPRTNLTLKPELHDLIQETADHLGLKRAQLITNLLEEFAPQLEKMCIAFREIKEKQVDPLLLFLHLVLTIWLKLLKLLHSWLRS
jgi:hypothetical protein